MFDFNEIAYVDRQKLAAKYIKSITCRYHKIVQNTDKVDYLKEVNKKYNIEHFMQQNDIIRVQSSTKMTSQEFRVQQK